MRQAELNNWSLDPTQMADLCSSINQFFTATGVIPPQGTTHQQAQVQLPPSAPQHPAQPHGALHPKHSHHSQHGQHNQHIGTGMFTWQCFTAMQYELLLENKNLTFLDGKFMPVSGVTILV